MLIIEHFDLWVNLKYFADHYFFSIKIPVNIVHGAYHYIICKRKNLRYSVSSTAIRIGWSGD